MDGIHSEKFQKVDYFETPEMHFPARLRSRIWSDCLENSRYWREIQEQMTRDEGRMELTNSEWIQWFNELQRIDKPVEENRGKFRGES
jgi:hypothetical protein